MADVIPMNPNEENLNNEEVVGNNEVLINDAEVQAKIEELTAEKERIIEDYKKNVGEDIIPINQMVDMITPTSTLHIVLDKEMQQYDKHLYNISYFMMKHLQGICYVKYEDIYVFNENHNGVFVTDIIPVMHENFTIERTKETSKIEIRGLSIKEIVSMVVYNIDDEIQKLNDYLKREEIANKLPDLSLKDAIEQIKQDPNVSSVEVSSAESTENCEENPSPEPLNDIAGNTEE